MQLRYYSYKLELKHVFRIASGARAFTPIVLVEIEDNGLVGYGEASLPPYLKESAESVVSFLSKIELSKFDSPLNTEDILDYVDRIEDGNTAAKAAVDIALHDLAGKIMGIPLYKLWGYSREKAPLTSFTIGITEEKELKERVDEADPYRVLKIKLGSNRDKEIVESLMQYTQKPLYVDVNQGWNDKYMALDMAFWLKEKGVTLLEQPLPKENIDDIAWLTQNSPIPIFADEGIQRLSDLIALKGVYSGVNIKLMKCTGLREAQLMLQIAKSFGMKAMVGCMTETSCAISAASHVALAAEYADLDGALLISNDVFSGAKVVNGRMLPLEIPGIGVSIVTP